MAVTTVTLCLVSRMRGETDSLEEVMFSWEIWKLLSNLVVEQMHKALALAHAGCLFTVTSVTDSLPQRSEKGRFHAQAIAYEYL